MNTWVVQATGASLALLAAAVATAPGRLSLRWRPADSWHAAVGITRTSRLRLRRRVGVILLQMIGEDEEQPPPDAPRIPDEEFWSSAEPDDAAPVGGYRSKHRLPGPEKFGPDSHGADPTGTEHDGSGSHDAQSHRPQGHQRAPRHAAPPTSESSPAAW